MTMRQTVSFIAVMLFLVAGRLTLHPIEHHVIAEKQADEKFREEVKHLTRRGQLNKAMKKLRERLKVVGRDPELRRWLARLVHYDGRPNDAVEVLEDGIENRKSDLPLLQKMANIYIQRAQDGPTVTRRRGQATYAPQESKEKVEAFRTKYYRKAISVYDRMLKRKKETSTAVHKAQLLMKIGQFDQVIQLLESYRKSEPSNTDLLLTLAGAKRKAGHQEEAMKTYQQALTINQRLPEAHEALETVHRKKGNDKRARLHGKKREFYKWLPDFCDLEFNTRNYQTYSKLKDPRKQPKEDREKAEKIRENTVQTLLKKNSDRARQLLVAYSFHDPSVGDILDKLKKEGAADLLMGMLRNTRGYPSRRKQVLERLAHMKHKPCFKRMVELLPRDKSLLCPIDVAGALATFGDPRAVPHLIEVLRPEQTFWSEQKRKSKKRRVPMKTHRRFKIMGAKAARMRAAFALGSFDTKKARSALKKGLSNEEVAIFCAAALYRMTRKETYWKSVKQKLEDMDEGPIKSLVKIFMKKIGNDEIRSELKTLDDAEDN